MSTAARLLLLEHSFLRVSQLAPPKFTAFFSPSSIRLRRYATASSAIDSAASTPTQQHASPLPVHPWPEWVHLVDRLRAKGYFASQADAEETGAGAGVYTDMKLLKNASLSFARDRFDIFSSLSKDDIQNVVGKGCPNTLRKPVNSAKRLRAYLELNEGDVCSSCDLRGSCDRACVVLEDPESPARTVDILRIILFYALDPMSISGEKKSPGREQIELSARKLLSQLIELDETPLDPDLPKSTPVPSPKRKPSAGMLFNGDNGEWECAKCKVQNSSKDFQCRSCGWKIPRVNLSDVELKKGDWRCRGCSFINFARNVRCLKCNMDGPERTENAIEMKAGDWNCPQCSFMNFASKRSCLRCQEPRPQRQMRPGDWECTRCDFLNFRGNLVCKKCNLERSSSSTKQTEDQHTWKRPSKFA